MSIRQDAIPSEVATLFSRLASESSLEDFALGGGTAIALRIPYRRSIDLDYFATAQFDSMRLQDALAASLKDFALSNRTQGSLRFMSGGVKAEFFHHPYPLLTTIETHEGVGLLSLDDLAAMKVNAVTNRGSKKDFSDLLALHEHGLPLARALDLFCRKYGESGRLLAVRSLLWFDDAEVEPDPMYLNGWSWSDVRSRLEKLASDLLM